MSTEHDVSIVSGSSVIKNMDKEKYDIMPVYIDKTGTVVIPFKYSYASGFSDGLARVKYKGRWEFINKKGVPLKITLR